MDAVRGGSGAPRSRCFRRVPGERGSGSWEEVSWDEALVTVADAVIDALDAAGSDAVVFDQGAEAGVLASMARTRLGRALDCVNLDVNASVSDVHLGNWATFGNLVGGSTADDTFRSDVVIVWNGNPAFTRIPYFHYLPEARYRGAKIVLVAPDFSPSAIHADMSVPVRPGTDAALALSMCQVILEEGRADLNFVRSQTYLPLLVVCATGRFLTGADMEAGGMPHRFYGWGEGAAEQVDPARFRLPAGDARPEWDVFAALACAISERAVARGLEVFRDSQGANRSFADVGGSFMAGGRLADGESVLDELLRDSALSGNLPADTSLATIRERGWVRPVRLPRPMSSMCGADISASEPMVAYRTHVEEGVAFETLTGRAQFYVDHPWFLEADEQLPRHKETPAMGGDHPFCLTGGASPVEHPRHQYHQPGDPGNYPGPSGCAPQPGGRAGSGHWRRRPGRGVQRSRLAHRGGQGERLGAPRPTHPVCVLGAVPVPGLAGRDLGGAGNGEMAALRGRIRPLGLLATPVAAHPVRSRLPCRRSVRITGFGFDRRREEPLVRTWGHRRR